MDMNVLLRIDEEKKETVKVEAFSNTSANIYIIADNMATAKDLLLQAEQQATEAMQNWEPAEQEEEIKAPTTAAEPHKHYLTFETPIEDALAAIKKYESTAEGARYAKRLKKAQDFCFKKCHGMGSQELTYFYKLINADKMWEAIGGAYNIAYMKGYNKAKSEQTRKAKKC